MSINNYRFAILATLLVAFTSVMHASASNIYIAQGGATGAAGSSCRSPLPTSFFNTAGNWGSASNKIGPGTTVHLCGTFSAGAGTTGLLQFKSGGAAGQPVTLLFESGAVLTAPYWGSGAITAQGVNYIVIDGGKNGIIQATQNGSAQSNRADGSGISFQSVSNSEVKNLTLSNLYVHSNASDEQGQNTFGVFWLGGSNITIDQNICHDVHACFVYAFTTANAAGVSVFSNTIHDTNYGVVVGDAAANAVLSGPVKIHDNVIHDFSSWDDSGNLNRHNGILCLAYNSSSTLNACSVYNNYIYGDPGTKQDAFISDVASPGANGCTGVQIFNNVLVNSSNTHFPANGLISDQCLASVIANNTLIGSTSGTAASLGLVINGDRGAFVGNNSFSHFYTAVSLGSQGVSSLSAEDYNNFFDTASVGSDNTGTRYATLLTWRACAANGCASGQDQNSGTGNPNLSAQFIPQTGSALIQKGTNATIVGIAELDLDKAGTPRPSSGPWDIGAYYSGLAAPASVSVSVNPPSLSLAPSKSQQFTATVTGSTMGVKWSMKPTMGSLSTAGLYTAPATNSTQQVVQVTATSMADATKSATANITLTPAASTTSAGISVSPTTATVAAGAQQQFVANISGGNAGAMWSLNSTVGYISPSGLYTAPSCVASQTNIVVTAISAADTTKSATASLTVQAGGCGITSTPPPSSPPSTSSTSVGISVSPTTATVAPGARQQFVLNGSAGAMWSLNSIVGYISPSGLYTAPSCVASQTNIVVTAISAADTTKSATASLTVQAGGCGLTSSPPSSTSSTTPVSHYVALNWSASTSSAIAGYNVYRSSTGGAPYSQVNASAVPALTFTDNSVTAGQAYIYVLTALDTGGNESNYSTPVTTTVPTP